MGNVIGLAGFQLGRQPWPRTTRAHCPEHAGFTPRDRFDLEQWSRSGRSVSFCASDMGAFAMLYQKGQMWASWGAVRQGGTVLIWNCVSLADVGRFPTMMEALAELPTGDAPALFHNIVHLVDRGDARV